MKLLHKLRLPLMGIAIILSSLTYVGCEGDDDGVDDYFQNNPYTSSDRESVVPLPPDKPATNPVPASLSISPTSTKANPGQKVGFQATGGSAPYSWSVGIAAHGNVSPQSNNKYAIYTHLATSADINNVIVKDAAGAVAIANVN
jgi:hypothetical protein